ncbi:mating-type protein MAT alpha 1-domain-containing protein [Diplogelasinospora grovesii]|uniref:Mating-type protein MAT alpha 1-domain-containing protein n=1 Tax=Diplogelasinospora grovesii TaxID=303347 RepID=A0AAN6S858_9PEZI|nr:mating-type protein MAT alpha 1-domain-containing protein [Diplogelasinospora grovesii]
MSGVNQILQNFAELEGQERETTMKALSTMMGETDRQQPAKKKVNAFIGFRAYYSALFWQFPQKQRSPFITALWQADPFRNEWDFLCSVYSAIRIFLEKEDISLQDWIHYAVNHLGIIPRESYVATLGWQVVLRQDGIFELVRKSVPPIQHNLQLMNGLDLFRRCFDSGLPVSDPQPIFDRLSDPGLDLMCMNTQQPNPVDVVDTLQDLVSHNPAAAMSALFAVSAGHPMTTKAIDGYNAQCVNELQQEQRHPYELPVTEVGFSQTSSPSHRKSGKTQQSRENQYVEGGNDAGLEFYTMAGATYGLTVPMPESHID